MLENVTRMTKKVTNFGLLAAVYSEGLATKFSLNPACTLVLIGLVSHYNPDKSIVFPSQGYLAEHLNLSERTVIRAIKELTLKGLLFKSKNGNSNVYCFSGVFFDAVRMSGDRCQDVVKVADKMSAKHDKYKYKNNIVNFNKSFVEGQKYPSVETTKEYIAEQQKIKPSSPLDFTKDEAEKWLKELPAFAKNGYFASELRRKWGFKA